MFGTKKKLMAAVVMLVISAIMMTSASYAWFTISTNPVISEMNVKMVTNENLEIALAQTQPTTINEWLPGNEGNTATGQYTWGNIIDLTDTNFDTIITDTTLRPCTLIEPLPLTGLNDNKLQYPNYTLEGRLDATNPLLDITPGTMEEGFGQLVGGSKTYGYYIDFWIRSNIGGALTLRSAIERNTGGEMGDGSYFMINDTTTTGKLYAEHVRVAFEDITPDEVTGADAPLATDPTEPRKSTTGTADKVADGPDVGKYKADITNPGIVTLTENSAKLVRMYVYFEGSDLTNAQAMLGNTDVSGVLNIQFAVADVTNSMH